MIFAGHRTARFCVLRHDPQTNNRSIWQASADGRNLHPLLPGWTPRPTMLWQVDAGRKAFRLPGTAGRHRQPLGSQRT